MNFGKTFVAALALSLAPAAFALPVLSIGDVTGQPGQTVIVPVNFTNDASQITALQFDVNYDPTKITGFGPLDTNKIGWSIQATDHIVDSNFELTNPTRIRVLVLSNNLAPIPSGKLLEIPMTLASGAVTGTTALELTGVELVEAAAEVVVGDEGDGRITIGPAGCEKPGNVLDRPPTDVGRVNIFDVIEANKRLRPGNPPTAEQKLCGNIDPGEKRPCSDVPNRKGWCPNPDTRFNLFDVLAIRRLTIGYVVSCLECASRVASRVAPSPGDVAPRGTGDGRTDIADVVLALRHTVGLEAIGVESSLADVAPASHDGATTVADGNGTVDIGDVVLLLRAAVGLEQLAWATREIEIILPSDVARIGFNVRVSGWPSTAEVLTSTLVDCAGEASGLDDMETAWGLTCVTEPQVVTTSGILGTVQYRGPRVDLTMLTVESDIAGPELSLTTDALRLQAR